MKVASVREFRDRATSMFHSEEPILVLRRGKLAGVFFPHPSETLPIELKRELFGVLSAQVAKSLRKAGVGERKFLADFQRWRRAKREGRRRR